MGVAELAVADLEQFYQQMWRIRLFEEHVGQLAAAGEVPGFVHLSIGQEAVAVGVCAALAAADTLYSNHRAHGHLLARGCDAYAVLAEILGRQDGLCGGRAGSMHLVDTARGVLGATGVVGGNLPLALGAAWAARELGQGQITAVFFGDGATGGGVFHESLNLAALWRLPVLFVCDNNGYAEFSRREEHSPVPQASAFAAPYGIPAQVVDGADVLAVVQGARQAAACLRQGAGPWFLECMTYRRSGHYAGDSQTYRSADENAAWEQQDPLQRLARLLAERGCPEARLAALAGRARTEMDQVRARARRARRPDPAAVLAHVYADTSCAATSAGPGEA